MKFFKKPFGAFAVCLLLVLVSTLLSVKIKLQSKCDDITHTFYSGVTYSGELHTPVAELLSSYCGIANGMTIIAGSYELDTQSVKDGCEYLESALAYSPDDSSYIHYEYAELRTALKTMEDKLYHMELSDRHRSMLEDYSEQLDEIESGIAASGYNETVRAFLQEYDRVPTNYFARICNVHFPEYFA